MTHPTWFRAARWAGAVALLSAGFVWNAPALAWTSPFHTGATQLMRNVWEIPGVQGSKAVFVLSGNAGQMCYTEGNRTAFRDQLAAPQRVYLDLVCGSDEPDRERANKPYRIDWWFTHQKWAPSRAVDAFNAAIGQHNAKAYSEAARQLGHSLHYLQDLYDFSKNMSSIFSEKDERFRGYANQTVQDYLEEWQRSRQYPPKLTERLNFRRSKVQRLPNTPQQMVAPLLEKRDKDANDFKELWHKTPSHEREDILKFYAFFHSHDVIAYQEHWVRMYLRAIGITPRF